MVQLRKTEKTFLTEAGGKDLLDSYKGLSSEEKRVSLERQDVFALIETITSLSKKGLYAAGLDPTTILRRQNNDGILIADPTTFVKSVDEGGVIATRYGYSPPELLPGFSFTDAAGKQIKATPEQTNVSILAHIVLRLRSKKSGSQLADSYLAAIGENSKLILSTRPLLANQGIKGGLTFNQWLEQVIFRGKTTGELDKLMLQALDTNPSKRPSLSEFAAALKKADREWRLPNFEIPKKGDDLYGGYWKDVQKELDDGTLVGVSPGVFDPKDMRTLVGKERGSVGKLLLVFQ